MTECERIIKEGILPESFFEEEIKCDYLITKQQKEIWAVELDLLLRFVKVCEENNLKYFLYAGTLLGAIRHKGFIPWDDDIDILMPRDDYEKFLKLYDEFKPPYFLQTPETDSGSGYMYAKLRNSNTTCLIKKFAYNKELNQGILIDILPLDEWDVENGQERMKEMINFAYENSTFMRKDNPKLNDIDRGRVENLPKDFNPVKNYKLARDIAMSYGKSDTDYPNLLQSTFIMNNHPLFFPKRIFSDVAKCEFEGYEFNMPAGYDEQLTSVYGDYMKLPPVEERKTVHNDCVFEPNKDYKTFIKEWIESN